MIARFGPAALTDGYVVTTTIESHLQQAANAATGAPSSNTTVDTVIAAPLKRLMRGNHGRHGYRRRRSRVTLHVAISFPRS